MTNQPNRSGYAEGERNLRFFGFDVHGPVFFASAALLLAIVAWVIAYPASATEFFAEALAFVTTRAGALMGSLGNLFVLFCLFLIVSPYGSVRLGGPQARPEFSNLSWFAMLFAAGMGIGMVFYSVAEPISHFSSSMAATTPEAAAAAPLGGAAG
ncbi:MAG: BCCT family transporter, partial [Nevskiaceae bacterium]